MTTLNKMYGYKKTKPRNIPEKKVTIHRSAKIQKLIIEGQEVWFPSIDYVHDLENELQAMKSSYQNLLERIRHIETRRR